VTTRTGFFAGSRAANETLSAGRVHYESIVCAFAETREGRTPVDSRIPSSDSFGFTLDSKDGPLPVNERAGISRCRSDSKRFHLFMEIPPVIVGGLHGSVAKDDFDS
jgi:hypothetical protein